MVPPQAAVDDAVTQLLESWMEVNGRWFRGTQVKSIGRLELVVVVVQREMEVDGSLSRVLLLVTERGMEPRERQQNGNGKKTMTDVG